MNFESSSVALEHTTLAAAVEQAADSIVMTGIDGKIRYVNPAFTAMTGYTSEEVVGQNTRFLKSGSHPEAFYKELWSTLLSGKVWQGELINRRKDGALYHEEMRIAPIRDADGAITGYIAIKHDVTEQRAAQEAQAFLAAIVENSEDSIIACTPEGTIRAFNRGAEAVFGYSAKEVIGQHMSMLVPPDRYTALKDIAQNLLRGQRLSQYEGICLRKDGCKIEVSVTGFPIKNSAGEVIAISNILHDITKRKQSERQLRESEERFRAIFEDAPVGMYVAGPDDRLIQVNEAACRMLGYSKQEMLAKFWPDLCPPDDMAEAMRRKRQLFNCGAKIAEAERRFLHRNGTAVWCQITISLLGTSEGIPPCSVVHMVDITARKRSEQALQSSEEKFRELAENIREVFWMMNATGTEILYIGPAYEQIWGRTCESLYANPMDWMEAIHLEDRASAREKFTKQLQGEKVDSEYRISTPDGQERWIRDQAFPVRNQAGQLVRTAGIAEDITERKLHEQELIRAQAETEAANHQLAVQNLILGEERRILRAFIDNVPDLVYVKDAECKFVIANPEVARWMGAEKPEDLLGKTDFDFFPEEVARQFYDDEQCVIRSSKPLLNYEEVSNDPKKTETRYLQTTKVPLLDSEGRVTGIAGIGRDITMRKTMEDALRESNRELQEATDWATKMALEAQEANRAKSEFLANMSHEIRTPMNGVLGMNGLLLGTDLNSEQRHFAEVVDASAKSLLTLIDDILDYSKIEAGKMEIDTLDFNLRVLMEDFAEVMAARIGEKKLEFVCAMGSDVTALLHGDPGRLRQVLLNLASNALKFTHQGEVVVRVDLVSETEAEAFLRFSVRDTGIGIPASKLSILFTSFTQVDASTTRQYGGTGLGLAISKKLVELMGGNIGVESKEHEGSEFWFTIRLAKQLVNKPEDASPASVKGARILVVDDNATYREVLTTQLQSWGAIVAAAESATTAMACLRYSVAVGSPFQLALLDMRMPGMDGTDLGRTILADETLKDIPLVMMTSLGQRGDAQRFKEIGFAAYLIKPLRQSDLFDCLVAVLTGERKKETRDLITRHSLREVRRGNARILLVEDNLTNQKVAGGMLRRLGWQSDVASDGKQAVQALETQSYDLVLMDVQMPVMDGYEATRLIRDPRSSVLNHNIPIIATTAHARAGDAEKCLAAGMSDYISKPIDRKILAIVVEKWLTRRVHCALGKSPLERAPSDSVQLPKQAGGSLVFNREMFLQRMMGDEQFAHDVTAGFMEELPALLSTLREQFGRGNLESVWKQAHKIKGSAANVGGEMLRDAAMAVEQAGKAGDSPRAAHLIPELEEQAVQLNEALREWAD